MAEPPRKTKDSKETRDSPSRLPAAPAQHLGIASHGKHPLSDVLLPLPELLPQRALPI